MKTALTSSFGRQRDFREWTLLFPHERTDTDQNDRGHSPIHLERQKFSGLLGVCFPKTDFVTFVRGWGRVEGRLRGVVSKAWGRTTERIVSVSVVKCDITSFNEQSLVGSFVRAETKLGSDRMTSINILKHR